MQDEVTETTEDYTPEEMADEADMKQARIGITIDPRQDQAKQDIMLQVDELLEAERNKEAIAKLLADTSQAAFGFSCKINFVDGKVQTDISIPISLKDRRITELSDPHQGELKFDGNAEYVPPFEPAPSTTIRTNGQTFEAEVIGPPVEQLAIPETTGETGSLDQQPDPGTNGNGQVKLTKSGKPRKPRSDAGKKRGKYAERGGADEAPVDPGTFEQAIREGVENVTKD